MAGIASVVQRRVAAIEQLAELPSARLNDSILDHAPDEVTRANRLADIAYMTGLGGGEKDLLVSNTQLLEFLARTMTAMSSRIETLESELAKAKERKR